MRITKKRAEKLSKLFDINHEVVPIEEWIRGLKIELEHGKKFGPLTNVTDDNLTKTAQIVVAHLIEDPRYYYYLEKMEKGREDYWKKHIKPSPFKL